MKVRRKNGIFKNMVRFLLGLSFLIFATRAFEIMPIVPNTINYLKTIFLTTNGSNTATNGVILEWSGGNWRFKGSLTVDSLPNVGVLGTNASGTLTDSSASTIYNMISGYALSGPQWPAWTPWLAWADGK